MGTCDRCVVVTVVYKEQFKVTFYPILLLLPSRPGCIKLFEMLSWVYSMWLWLSLCVKWEDSIELNWIEEWWLRFMIIIVYGIFFSWWNYTEYGITVSVTCWHQTSCIQIDIFFFGSTNFSCLIRVGCFLRNSVCDMEDLEFRVFFLVFFEKITFFGIGCLVDNFFLAFLKKMFILSSKFAHNRANDQRIQRKIVQYHIKLNQYLCISFTQLFVDQPKPTTTNQKTTNESDKKKSYRTIFRM